MKEPNNPQEALKEITRLLSKHSRSVQKRLKAQKQDKSKWAEETICLHCDYPIALRNPSGICDHLYYPDYCHVCQKAIKEAKYQ